MNGSDSMYFYEFFDRKYLKPISIYNNELKNWQDIEIEESNEDLLSLKNVSNKIIVEPIYYLENIGGTINDCMVRETIKNKLVLIAEKLPDGYFLKVWDGYRTIETQKLLFDKYYNIFKQELNLFDEKKLIEYTKKFVSYPSYNINAPSPHNTGAAVDVTICDINNNSIELGSYFDDFKKESNTRFYEEKLERGEILSEIEEEILYNRRILCNIFEEAGFVNYPYEIWHKSYKDQMYAELMDEKKAIYGSLEINEKLGKNL